MAIKKPNAGEMEELARALFYAMLEAIQVPEWVWRGDMDTADCGELEQKDNGPTRSGD